MTPHPLEFTDYGRRFPPGVGIFVALALGVLPGVVLAFVLVTLALRLL